MGLISYGENEESVFLGREMTSRREDYSEETAKQIDSEVHVIVDQQHQLARKIIADNRERLERLAQALLERETLDSNEIDAVLDGQELPPRQRVVIPTWAEKRKERTEKKRPASIFGAPKPQPS